MIGVRKYTTAGIAAVCLTVLGVIAALASITATTVMAQSAPVDLSCEVDGFEQATLGELRDWTVGDALCGAFATAFARVYDETQTAIDESVAEGDLTSAEAAEIRDWMGDVPSFLAPRELVDRFFAAFGDLTLADFSSDETMSDLDAGALLTALNAEFITAAELLELTAWIDAMPAALSAVLERMDVQLSDLLEL